MLTAEEIIKILNLKPLPREGGYYRETYHSKEIIPKDFLPSRYKESKRLSTAIYYLLTQEVFSLLHRLPTDEIFHFYLGDPVTMLQFHPDGTSDLITLGHEIDKNQQTQVIVHKNTWQGCFLEEGGKFALMGTTMSPGFDESDFEAGVQKELVKKYPDREELIIKLTS
ncbi:MAG: cupin domain-containing protein [Bacteroidetes bacterium]|nr:cupin domain-containing protein [Bacteroidota bacterium]